MAAFFAPASFSMHWLAEDTKLLVCHSCGALVPAPSQNPHRSFHAALDQLNEDRRRLTEKLRRLAR